MTDEQHIERVMTECGLVGFGVMALDGQPRYVAKTAEGNEVYIGRRSEHDDDGEWFWWAYENGETGEEGEFDTLDGALDALEQDFRSILIATLRTTVTRLEEELGALRGEHSYIKKG